MVFVFHTIIIISYVIGTYDFRFKSRVLSLLLPNLCLFIFSMNLNLLFFKYLLGISPLENITKNY
jgi:hypothetical protein